MPRQLIFEYALHQDPESGELISYWPEHWTVERLLDEAVTLTIPFFSASYQNDPSALEGNMLQREWLAYYLPEELEAYRRGAGIPEGQRGPIHAGVDLAAGGSKGDTDFCAVVIGERIGNIGFLIGLYMKRLKIELQAEAVEAFLDLYSPNFLTVEDTSERGYAWRDFTLQINDGRGTKYKNFEIETPQGRNASGAKETRFMSMAPRFVRTQIRIPGMVGASSTASSGTIADIGGMSPHPNWSDFVDQWCSFPAGHDDALDAVYWMQHSMFTVDPAVSVTKLPTSLLMAGFSADMLTAPCPNPAHAGYKQPITECFRCLINLEGRVREINDAKQMRAEEVVARSIGDRRPQRERWHMLR